MFLDPADPEELILTSALSRREFLFGVTATGVALALRRGFPSARQARRAHSLEASIPTHRVVHTHSDLATNWDYATGWYGNYVSQVVVDRMTDRGVMDLTGTLTRADAWRGSFPVIPPVKRWRSRSTSTMPVVMTAIESLMRYPSRLIQ